MKKIKEIFNSKAKRKIVYFFYCNPMSIDTLRGITAWTGISKKETLKSLEELVKADILIAHHSTSATGYAYTGNKKITNKIKKYFQETSEINSNAR